MDLLSNILSHVHLKGTLYFRTSFTSPWGLRVPSFENVSRYHFAHRGHCFVRIAEVKEPVLLDQGDLIIITRGASHTLYCDPATEDHSLPLDRMLEETGFTGSGTLVYGEAGTDVETQLVCGHFAFDDNTSHPLIEALPPYIHIKNYGETTGSWLENTLKVIGAEAGRKQMGSDLIVLKMSEIIFTQALRTYLNTDGSHKPVLAAFSDPLIVRTLKAIHDEPAFPWTLEVLSKIAGMSRTSFATKFSRYMSMTPLGYITNWRMQIARQLLADTKSPVIQIAERVGYQAEASFSRVFKKHFQMAPATFRRALSK